MTVDVAESVDTDIVTRLRNAIPIVDRTDIDFDSHWLDDAADEIERLREGLINVHNGLIDLLEDQDAILPELRALYDIAHAALHRDGKAPA